jgi:hypothetical protein
LVQDAPEHFIPIFPTPDASSEIKSITPERNGASYHRKLTHAVFLSLAGEPHHDCLAAVIEPDDPAARQLCRCRIKTRLMDPARIGHRSVGGKLFATAV